MFSQSLFLGALLMYFVIAKCFKNQTDLHLFMVKANLHWGVARNSRA